MAMTITIAITMITVATLILIVSMMLLMTMRSLMTMMTHRHWCQKRTLVALSSVAKPYLVFARPHCHMDVSHF